MAIRYDKKLEQEINRVIRNFNQKVKRLEKEDRDIIIPETISKKQIKEEVKTRQELKRRLEELQRFGKRGAEEKITEYLSKYEYENLTKRASRQKQRLSREITKLSKTKPTVAGKVQARTYAEMGDPELLTKQTTREALEKDITKLNKEELERYKKLIEKTEKYQKSRGQFRNNYYNMLFLNAYYINYDNGKIEHITEKLDTLSDSKFIDLFNTEKLISTIIEHYGMYMTRLRNAEPTEDLEEEMTSLYDQLYNSIDEIIIRYNG